jgi:hypothetical protein
MNYLENFSHETHTRMIRWLSIIEGIMILFTIAAFWHHSPPIRDQWVWLLWMPVVFFWLRMRLTGRIWTHTPLQDWLVLFVLLTAFNFIHAPYSRDNYMVLLSRPLLGIWIYIYAVEHARIFRRLHSIVTVMIVIGLITGLLALTATDWQTEQKAAGLQTIIDQLPVFDFREAARQSTTEICLDALQFIIGTPCFRTADLLRNSLLSFNPNEIAGALAWLAPFTAAIAISKLPDGHADRWWRLLRIVAGGTTLLLLLTLILGQSRFAIGGVLAAFVLIGWLLLDRPRLRWAALGVVLVLIVVQGFFLLNGAPGEDQNGLSTRDQRTFSTRFELWERGLRMMRDYPLTGAGMSMYRSAAGTERYAIAYYSQQGATPPHAHNEWAQIAADLGFPGLVLYLIWQIVVLKMIRDGWRSTDPYGRIIARAVFAGLLAHAVYGIGDAITLWDRFQFILWGLVGLAGAQWILIQPMLDESA